MVETGRMPNFKAMRSWMDKLETWCQLSIDRNERLQDEVESLTRELSEIRDWHEDYRKLAELVFDMERGLVKPDEVVARVREDVRYT